MKRTATAYFDLFVLLTGMALLTSGCSKSNPTGPATGTITGAVTDATTNTTISGATVTLGTQSATTSSGGSYSFSNVQAGNYTVTASANGYNSTSQQIQVSAGVPQTVDLSLQAVQESVPINSTLNSGYYSWQSFSFDTYPFVQCSNGFMSHNVRVTVTVNPTSNPINIIVMRPDGYYKLEADSTTAGLNQSFESNACGTWEVVVWNYGNAQTTISGNVSMDFSNYSVSGNDGSAQVQVPINYPSISPGSNGYAYFSRFLKQGMTYNLQLNISGGSGNDINLIIKNPDGSSAFDSRVSGNYTSQTFTATSTGLQLFEFDNSFSVFSSKSVTGTLLINRGISSQNLKNGQAKIIR